MHRGFHVDAASQTLQQQLNDSWNMTLIIANELPPMLSKPQSNQESTRLAVEAVQYVSPEARCLMVATVASQQFNWDLL